MVSGRTPGKGCSVANTPVCQDQTTALRSCKQEITRPAATAWSCVVNSLHVDHFGYIIVDHSFVGQTEVICVSTLLEITATNGLT